MHPPAPAATAGYFPLSRCAAERPQGGRLPLSPGPGTLSVRPHAMHSSAPALGAKVPGGQGVGSEAPRRQKVPGGQGAHTNVPGSPAKVPPGQISHFSSPVAFAKVPWSQVRQSGPAEPARQGTQAVGLEARGWSVVL